MSVMVVAEKIYASGLQETFSLRSIPVQPGTYRIKKFRLSEFGDGIPYGGFGMYNYDAGIGQFYPDTTRNNNYIQVIRCDTITNEIEARFQVFMGNLFPHSEIPIVPDSIFFTEGKFYLKIQP